ncbi:alpha/beta hydrolase fold domain-containing protein [Thalassoroseus pseudoceratinae]|uniref:alpha/beta hydrolase fold domain-containing protein n=1 Tax=Thalassoroseus pseudoceratinae TaxID=2713176 RepID=UPI00141EBA60|nr:alpha/beta hydrolase fold domain-containing protein [Thalassoroseus pseudoceratinae]
MATRFVAAIIIAMLPFSIVFAQNNDDRFVRRMTLDDKNGDGKLTQTEFSGPNRLFERLDADGDGVIVLKEAAKTLKEFRARVAKLRGDRTQPATDRPLNSFMRTGIGRKVKPDFPDVRYGDHERHVFDIYQTKTDDSKPAPCMIWIHGGGFRSGDKSQGGLFASSFTDHGIHYVSLNYRLSHHALAPACFHDCARALQFIRRNAAKWNIDKERIAVGGGSAGSGLSQWLAFHEDLADANATDPVLRESTRVSAVILLNAQTSYDLRWIKEHIPGDAWKGDGLQELFGYTSETINEISEEKFRTIEECSPLTHFSADAPPILFFYRRSRDPRIAEQNAMDGIHHPIFGLELKKIADKVGVECEVFTVEDEEDRVFYNRRWDYTVKFLKKHFG